MKLKIILGLLIGFCGMYFGPIAAEQPPAREDFRRPLTIPFPQDAPFSPLRATLGKMLFFDPRLSGKQNLSCASCHNPSFGWEVPTAGPVGASNFQLTRQAPTILNMAWVDIFFWDGRAPTLEHQASGPITASVEMDGDLSTIVDRLSAIQTYRDGFDQAFPDIGLTEETILTAIATFERSVVSGWSPFDRWVDGDEKAISEQAIRGFDVFVGRGQCVACHTGWNFTDNLFHDIGLDTTDIGRAGIEPNEDNSTFAFKTPGLRNIVYRSPYMHNGSIDELDAVISHYVSGGKQRASLSPLMQAVDLSEDDILDLVAFLESLTADESAVPTPLLPSE